MKEQQNALYLECYSGISGDMVTAALLDLGADETVLRKALDSLPLHGFEVEISRVKKPGWMPVILMCFWTQSMKITTMI